MFRSRAANSGLEGMMSNVEIVEKTTRIKFWFSDVQKLLKLKYFRVFFKVQKASIKYFLVILEYIILKLFESFYKNFSDSPWDRLESHRFPIPFLTSLQEKY